VHFFTIEVYIFKSTWNSVSFDTHEVHIAKKIFWPLYSEWPKKLRPMMKRSRGQQIFFAIFGTFEVYVTNLRSTFVEIVKKVKNQPTLLYSRVSWFLMKILF
jgi:hypothetical protein